MKKFFINKTEGDVLGDRLTAAARRMYQPPAVSRGDQNYWVSLESRIMSRVNDPAFIAALEPARWWTVLEGWSRPGLLAAGIAVAASFALVQTQQVDEGSAVYEYVSATSAPEAFTPSVDLVTQHEPGVQSDAVINYVLAR